MFDKNTVDAYKNITAPDELKEKVMASCSSDGTSEKRSFFGNMRMYATLAACFVLIVVFSAFAVGNFGDLSVSVSGRTLSSQPVVLSESGITPITYSTEPRMASRTTVPVELKTGRETDISVSGGLMKICDAKSGKELYTGTEFTAHADLLIYWSVTAENENPHFEMTIDGQKNSCILLLDFDENTKEWTICRKKAKN